MLLTKGNTLFIILIFETRKSKLNLGIVFTIILPLKERKTIEITNSLISLARKVVLSELRVEIAKKKIACFI
jgi:hypothetical protein